MQVECECPKCWHFYGFQPLEDHPQGGIFRCRAYPAGIPAEIFVQGEPHRDPRPDDNGFQYLDGDIYSLESKPTEQIS